MPAHGKVTSQDMRQKIADKYISGASVTTIAKDIGVSYSTIRDLLLRNGVLRRAAEFPLSRFEASFVVTPGCWLWTGEIGISGYGRFWAKRRRHRAHRYSYEVYKGEIPNGLLVLHSCDNPRCVNPDHLRVGTDFDNTQDKITRGRFNTKKRISLQV